MGPRKFWRSHLESLEIIVILVFAATVLVVSFLVRHFGHQRATKQSLNSVRPRTTASAASRKSNKAIPHGGHMTGEQSPNPYPEVPQMKAESTPGEPTQLDVAQRWEPAPAHFERGATTSDTFSEEFQEAARLLTPGILPERDGAATFDNARPALEEKPSLPLLETQVEPQDGPAAEEARITDAIRTMDSGYNGGREEVIAQQLGLLTFYGLIEQPFDVTPDPAYLYRSEVHEQAFTSLLQGVQNLRGFLALVAEPGMGKTTLLNKLMEELNGSARIVFLFQTQCNSRELLGYLLSEMGIDSAGMDVVAMHRRLNQALFEEMVNGRRFVLIVDEAQNLDASVLETIRLLSDFETAHTKLLQIVLAGQPQLVHTLMQPELSQLRQRISVLSTLEPLNEAETISYIEHRLRAAGAGGVQIFTREAMASIAAQSKGTPRVINQLCYSSLVAGHAEGCRIIGTDIVQRALKTLDFERLLACFPRQAAGNVQQQTAPVVEEKPSVTLTGRVGEKLRTRTWESNGEYRILVSLERASALEIPIADRYYCANFHVTEEQAKEFKPGQQIKIKIEAQ